jgi:hypothetical protein
MGHFDARSAHAGFEARSFQKLGFSCARIGRVRGWRAPNTPAERCRSVVVKRIDMRGDAD